MTDEKSQFVYVAYIRTTADELWSALTTPEITKKFWLGATFATDWKQGSAWTLHLDDGRLADIGEVLEIDPPKRLVLKWQHQFMPELKMEGDATCEIALEPAGNAVKLTIIHSIARADSKLIKAVSGGWPKIVSNLKSLLETGLIAVD
ncbi:MAG: SRPBCC family protein [Ancalomicrobiaceae bacterium]|nr:SRPBCC family protein [Ancalomicrobiaceae bacterium]